jgi:hypothetical protein
MSWEVFEMAKVSHPMVIEDTELEIEDHRARVLRPEADRLITCWAPLNSEYVVVREIILDKHLKSVRRLSSDYNYLVVTVETPRGDEVLTIKEMDYLGVSRFANDVQYIHLGKTQDGQYIISTAKEPNAANWKVLASCETLVEAVRKREQMIRQDARYVRYIRTKEKEIALYAPPA